MKIRLCIIGHGEEVEVSLKPYDIWITIVVLVRFIWDTIQETRLNAQHYKYEMYIPADEYLRWPGQRMRPGQRKPGGFITKNKEKEASVK